VKVAELMGDLGEDKGDGTSVGFFSIGDQAFDRHRKLFEQLLDGSRVRPQIALRTTE